MKSIEQMQLSNLIEMISNQMLVSISEVTIGVKQNKSERDNEPERVAPWFSSSMASRQ